MLVSPITWTHHRWWLLVPLVIVWSGRRDEVSGRGAGLWWQILGLLVVLLGPVERGLPDPIGWVLRENAVLLGLAVLATAAVTGVHLRRSWQGARRLPSVHRAG